MIILVDITNINKSYIGFSKNFNTVKKALKPNYLRVTDLDLTIFFYSSTFS